MTYFFMAKHGEFGEKAGVFGASLVETVTGMLLQGPRPLLIWQVGCHMIFGTPGGRVTLR